MDNKIFLQGFDSKTSSNTSNGLNTQFKGRRKLLPSDDIAKVISQYDQYSEERKNCNKIRLTCQVNPVCTNVLFNRITEIVKDEGSPNVSFINYDISSNTNIFDGVIYKPKGMDFWGGQNFTYQGSDTEIKNSTQTIYAASNSYKKHGTGGTVVTPNVNHPTNSIRDTQLSNEKIGFKYHCGLDIFNNHLIRSNTFKTVCRMPDIDNSKYTSFNTIADLMRNTSGNKVVEKIYFPVTANVPNQAKIMPLHLYEYDDLDTFNDCIKNKLISKFTGWVGFENKSKIKSYFNFNDKNDEGMDIERPLMYMNGGDFVEMYPGRDLYSFVPKYNKFRKRIEKNWNYCITYPSSSYTPSNKEGEWSVFNDIIECANGVNSLKAIYFDENTRADNGTSQLVIYGIAKHGLSQGDRVNIYKTYIAETYWVVDGNGTRISDYYATSGEASDAYSSLTADYKAGSCGERKPRPSRVASSNTNNEVTVKILDSVEVAEIVDDYIFTVFNASTQISNNWVYLSKQELNGTSDLTATVNGSINTYKLDKDTKKFFLRYEGVMPKNNTRYYIVNNAYVNIDDTAQRISYKKVVNGIECQYYVRVFSKLPNFKFAEDDTSNENQLYKNNELILRKYQDKEYDFESHVSRLAFAKNIYTDEVGEIVFTDDIDISNLHDNLGRPLTSLYLTIIKNNRGYKEWYGFNYSGSTPWTESQISASTVEYSHAFGKITCGIKTSEESIYDNSINCINKINNIGDVGCPYGYSIAGVINGDVGRYYETEDKKKVIISDNEVWYDTDTRFWGDLCYYDGYNAIERHIDYIMHRFNTAQRETVQSMSNEHFSGLCYDEIAYDDYDTTEEYTIKTTEANYVCNNKREGYYYNPHYEIPIKTFDKLKSAMPDFLRIREFKKVLHTSYIYDFVTQQQHFLSVGDKAVLYDTVNEKYYNLFVTKINGEDYKAFTCRVYDERTNEPSYKGITYMNNGTEETIERISSPEVIGSITVNDFKLFKMDNIDAPSYCKVLKDGTCRVIWRDVINNGFDLTDKSVEEYPFTNGAFYVNRRVDLYVRRQDPYGIYGLYDEQDIEGNRMDIVTEDNYSKETEIKC